MKANELRIGNLITTLIGKEVLLPSEIIHKVGKIGFFDVDIYNPEKSFAEQEPKNIELAYVIGIPITEEWLLRFGFVLLKDFYQYHGLKVYSYDNGEFEILLQDDNSFKYWEVKDVLYMDEQKYVHQLQNLYFALTGEEIEGNYVPHYTVENE